MRPFASLVLLLPLAACGTVGNIVGNPFDGFADFLGDTVSFKANPNRPVPESDNIRRVMGQDVQAEPILSEAGNIWPAMPRVEPTKSALEQPPAPLSMRGPVGSPSGTSPGTAPLPLTPVPAATSAAPSIPSAAPIASGTALVTGKGAAIITTGNSGIMTYTLPSGATGRAIDNGNGTMTLIGTDGTVMTAPAPR